MNSPAAGKFALIIAAGLALASAHPITHALPTARPSIYFWAWDEPEDMRPLAGQHAGVAYLAATILLDQQLHIKPRFQPLSLAPGTPLIAVVRVETRPGFRDSSQIRRALRDAVLDATNRPEIHAIQIDFDAAQSEREFYTAVLTGLRANLPRTTTLSITALLSWCAHDDWIRALPIDEAVPMYFRLGREAHNILNGDSAYSIREPLCSTSAGIATDEPSRNLTFANKRVYIFNPHPWTARQLQLLAQQERP